MNIEIYDDLISSKELNEFHDFFYDKCKWKPENVSYGDNTESYDLKIGVKEHKFNGIKYKHWGYDASDYLKDSFEKEPFQKMLHGLFEVLEYKVIDKYFHNNALENFDSEKWNTRVIFNYFSYGDYSDGHTDSLTNLICEQNFSVIFYLSEVYNLRCGGNIIFIDDSQEIIKCVLPKPARAVIFPSTMQHQITAMTNISVLDRLSVAYQFFRKEN